MVLAVMMLSLHVLNSFWTYYMIESLIEVNKKNKHGGNSYE